jgi:hypothetical protein
VREEHACRDHVLQTEPAAGVLDTPLNGICPVTNTQPSTSTAWLNGATGSGAPGIMWNVGRLIGTF